MLQGLEHLIQERLERAGSVHPGEEKDQGNLISVYKKGTKQKMPGFLQ